ncbi:MAG TPA: hypothetical protein VG965_03345 [Patescibacteria group bacterium]|nr:hypothetical protein [Patescibacteria group bacterium]
MNFQEGDSVQYVQAAEKFMREHGSHMRKDAQEIAYTIQSLFDLTKDIGEDQSKQCDDGFYFRTDDEYSILCMPDALEGLGGDGGIALFHYFDGDNQERFRRDLGVDTPNRLVLGMQTDPDTEAAVRDYLTVGIQELGLWEHLTDNQKAEEEDLTFDAIGLSDDIETDFFVDIDGNFAKVCGLPREIEDLREKIQLEGFDIESMYHVRASMTPSDFALMKSTLYTLTTRVHKYLADQLKK